MVQALIVRDPFDNKEVLSSLKKELPFCSKVFEIDSITQFDMAKNLLDLEEPCIFFPNIFIRYENFPLSEIGSFHEKNKCFSALLLRTIPLDIHCISFIPKYVSFNKQFNILNYNSTDMFYISNLEVKYKNIKNEEPIIFLYTWNRSEYLKLTLNSLTYSMIDTFPIKIVMNDPTPDVKRVASEFAAKYDFIELLEIIPNSVFSPVNIMVQWFRPKKFILMEDDFILPHSTKKYFPNWAFQFMDRLNYFDMVGFSWSQDNGPLNFKMERNVDHYWADWVYDYKKGYNLAAQCLAVNTDFYINALKQRMLDPKGPNPYYAPFDEDMQRMAKKVCIPSIKGFHIGHNELADGYERRTVKPNHPLTYKVKSLNTGEEKFVNIKELLNLYI